MVSLQKLDAHPLTSQILQVEVWYVLSRINYSILLKVVIYVCAPKHANLPLLTLVGRHNLKHKEGVLKK